VTGAACSGFRLLTEADQPLLRDRLTHPQLQRWWREADITRVGP